MTYTIKPLEWVQEDFRTWNAISGDAFYTAFLSSDDRWKVYFKGSAIGDSETLEDAKKVAETHRDKLLLLQLEPAPALQATQYLLARGSRMDWPVLAEYSFGAGVWFVSHFEKGTMNNKTGGWSISEPVDSLEYAFRTPAEAAECFYRHYPHLKPQPQPQQ